MAEHCSKTRRVAHLPYIFRKWREINIFTQLIPVAQTCDELKPNLTPQRAFTNSCFSKEMNQLVCVLQANKFAQFFCFSQIALDQEWKKMKQMKSPPQTLPFFSSSTSSIAAQYLLKWIHCWYLGKCYTLSVNFIDRRKFSSNKPWWSY